MAAYVRGTIEGLLESTETSNEYSFLLAEIPHLLFVCDCAVALEEGMAIAARVAIPGEEYMYEVEAIYPLPCSPSQPYAWTDAAEAVHRMKLWMLLPDRHPIPQC